jgi:general secretion pathway protein D
MKNSIFAGMALCLAVCAGAQPSAEGSSSADTSRSGETGGVPLTQLIAAVAKSTGKKFLVDPRARAEVAVAGTAPSSVSYNDLIAILLLHGFVVVEGNGAVQVVPNAVARSEGVPLLKEKEIRPDAEIVTDTIRVKNSPAMRLVPILRPLVPQFGHLVADKCSNTLVLVDTYANVRRLEAIVQRLDVGEPYKLLPCDAQEMNQPREPGK